MLFIFNPAGLPGLIYLLAEYLPYLILFPVAFILCGLKGDRFDTLDNAPMLPSAILLLTGSLIAFIFGDFVNFSLEEPSTQFLFFFLAGMTLSAAQPQRQPSQQIKFGPANVGYLLATIVCASILLYPAVKAENAAIHAEKSVGVSDPAYDTAYQTFAELADRFPYDAHLTAEAGERLITLTRTSSDPAALIEQAIERFEQASQKAPGVWEFSSKEAQCWLMLMAIDPDRKLTYIEKAEALFQRARNIAPRSKNLAMTLGLLYAQHARLLPPERKEERKTIFTLARTHLTDAINLDRALPIKSIRHLSNRQLHDIQTALEAAK
jgi:tetratricopeptide (TPR) repeat protein